MWGAAALLEASDRVARVTNTCKEGFAFRWHPSLKLEHAFPSLHYIGKRSTGSGTAKQGKMSKLCVLF